MDGLFKWNQLKKGRSPNRTLGPITFKVATAPTMAYGNESSLNLGFLQESRNGLKNRSRSLKEDDMSRQTLFIAGTGSASTVITVPEPGIYALIYSVAHKRDQDREEDARNERKVNPIKIFADLGQGAFPITPSGQSDPRPNLRSTTNTGYWAKAEIGFDFFGSAPFQTTEPNQRVRITFAAEGKARNKSCRSMMSPWPALH